MSQILENNGNGNSNNHNADKVQSVDELLPLDSTFVKLEENLKDTENTDLSESETEEDPATVKNQHDFVTSPWSRLGIIGGAFGVAFLVVFIVLSGMMNGGNQTAKKPEVTPTHTSTTFEQKDGDAYAKLALAKQQEELEALNGKEKNKEQKKQEEELPPEKSNVKGLDNPKTKETTKNPLLDPREAPKRVVVAKVTELPPRQQRTYREPAIATSPRHNQVAFRPIQQERPLPASNVSSRSDKLATSTINPQSKKDLEVAKDPLAEIERLRNLGSVGRVQYVSTKNTEVTPTAASSTTERTVVAQDDTSTDRPRRRRNSSFNQENTNNGNDTNNQVEELRPRWQPTSLAENKGRQQLAYNYLSEESQILEEKKAQYLVIGSFARATLVTPLVLPQSNTSNRQQLSQRFVAQLNEPIYSNTDEIALEKGTLLTVTITSVDGSSNVNAEVTAIIKDETEYPLSPGTISVLGEGGSPLIARPYKDKGPEIAKYDTTLGAIAGIAKVGEIINRPDEQVTEYIPFGGTISRSSNNNRNIGAAFIQGAFGKLGETIGKRTERATDEIINRPVVWYVPKNTKITVKVDRSLKL